MWITLGGNLIDYPGNCSTPTANFIVVKLLLNGVLSMPGAKFMTINAKNFYYQTPMDPFEYMRICIEDLTQEIINLYELEEKNSMVGVHRSPQRHAWTPTSSINCQ